jgi:hypothetical protein
MARGDSYQLQGQGGGIVMGPGDVLEGNFRWIQIVNDTVIQTMSSTNILNLSDLVNITLPAGLGIGGNFTAITMLSGVAIAYYE